MKLPRLKGIKAPPPPPMEVPTVCSRTDCGKPSRWAFTLYIHAIGHPAGKKECKCRPGLALCDDHKLDEFARGIVSWEGNPDGHRQIREMFKAMGMADPDLHDVRVEWEELKR